MGVVKQGLQKLRQIHPREIEKAAQRPFSVLLHGEHEEEGALLKRWFVPATVGEAERRRALDHLTHPEQVAARVRAHLVIPIVTPGAAVRGELPQPLRHPALPAMTILDPLAPAEGIQSLLRAFPEHALALGRAFPPLRDAVAHALVRSCAARNATLAALSAVGEVIPTPLAFVWAAGEMASDSVLLTANQVRLALQLAALYDDEVGWMAQRTPLLGIVAGAFGWRALARQLVALIPDGIGLVAKSGMAYTGTLTVGRALAAHHRHRLGDRLAQSPSVPARGLARRPV